MIREKIMSRKTLLLLALLLASALSVGLVLARAVVVGQLYFWFLVWNLFLAWLPFLFAELSYIWRQRPLPFLGVGFLWFIFLPNSLYIVTDLMHLRPLPAIPVWYDAFMIFSFALTGLLLGFLSLQRMHDLVAARYGFGLGWLFAANTLALSSFGIYIGRFLRWNSWDIFTNPGPLLADIARNLLTPHLGVKTAVVSGLLCAIFLLAYAVLTLSGAVATQPVSPSGHQALQADRLIR